jgi:hypothetical protein
MLPIGSTAIPEVEEGPELLTLNGAQVINVETHRHRGNRKSKNAVSQLKHFEIHGEPTKGSLEKMTNRNRIQLEDASTKENHQPEGRPQTGASRANRSFQGIPEGFREDQAWPKVQEGEIHSGKARRPEGRTREAGEPELGHPPSSRGFPELHHDFRARFSWDQITGGFPAELMRYRASAKSESDSPLN